MGKADRAKGNEPTAMREKRLWSAPLNSSFPEIIFKACGAYAKVNHTKTMKPPHTDKN